MKKTSPVKIPAALRNLSSKGFTLIELLVVISIIAILAGLALTVMSRATQSAKETKALNPLRDVTKAGVIFSVENNGQINTLKYEGDPKELESGQYVSGSFWGRIQPHLFQNVTAQTQAQLKTDLGKRIDELLQTSDSDTMKGTMMEGAKIYHDTSGLPIPFSFNKNLYKWNTWITVNEVGGPTGIIYMTYGWNFFDETDATAYVKWPTNGTKPTNPIRYLSNQKIMASFLDGHVEQLSPPVIKRYFIQDPNNPAN